MAIGKIIGSYDVGKFSEIVFTFEDIIDKVSLNFLEMKKLELIE